LRTLLITVVLLSLPLGWLALKMRETERQRRAVEAIRKAGGEVHYDWQLDEYGNVIRKQEHPAPAWLRELLGEDFLADVVSLSFGRSEELDDVVLEHVKGLTNLKRLWLAETQVTDAGLEHLRGWTQLKRLELDDTQVSDAGLEHLKGLTELGTLILDGTHVTDKGVEELWKALPNCDIYWDEDPTN